MRSKSTLIGGVLCMALSAFSISGQTNIGKYENELAAVKSAIEQPGAVSPALLERYDWLTRAMYDCTPSSELKENRAAAVIDAPEANLCINGALSTADPNFNRVLLSTTGTGVGNGTAGNCSLSGSGNAVEYDAYRFNLTGCAVFPTEITATLCGPAGCQLASNIDTALIMYRRVAAGDALTANGGIGTAFNAASACANAVAASDDLGTTSGTANNPGGATCNQVVGANCVAPCTSPSSAGGLSGFRRQLGNGNFTLVIAGFGNSTVGTYNLYVDAPAAGCQISLVPTAAEVNISGQVKTAGGQPVRNAAITLNGGELTAPIIARTNAFGYYSFPAQSAGHSYALSIASKTHTFAEPTMLLTANSDTENANFVSVE